MTIKLPKPGLETNSITPDVIREKSLPYARLCAQTQAFIGYPATPKVLQQLHDCMVEYLWALSQETGDPVTPIEVLLRGNAVFYNFPEKPHPKLLAALTADGWEFDGDWGPVEDEPAPCIHRETVPGPRVPLRHGTSTTEICASCTMWRTTIHTPGRWQKPEELAASFLEYDW